MGNFKRIERGQLLREATKQYRDKRRARLRGWLALLKDKPCMDCRDRFPPECMEFDHVRGKKAFEINNRTVPAKTQKRVLTEIAKCDLICANCHRIRTTRRSRS